MKAAAVFSCLPSKSPSLQLDLIPLRLHPGEELREDRLFRHQELPPLHSTPNLTQSPDPPPNTWTVSILPSLPNGPSQYLPNHTRIPCQLQAPAGAFQSAAGLMKWRISESPIRP